MVAEWNSQEEKIQILAPTTAFTQSGCPSILIYSDILWTFSKLTNVAMNTVV